MKFPRTPQSTKQPPFWKLRPDEQHRVPIGKHKLSTVSYLSKHRGDRAENLALQFLQEQGLYLVTRNYRCRWGEIDLVMREDDTLVFVEVRYRSTARFGGAAMSVASHKQARLVRSAQHYLCTVAHDIQALCRIDVVALDTRQWAIDWIKNAFTAEA